MSSNASRTSAVTLAHAATLNQRCSSTLVLLPVSWAKSVHQAAAIQCSRHIRLLYISETWTLTKSDEQKLEAFQMSSCLRRILGRRWFNFVPNVSVMNQTQQRSICSRICDRRVSIFGHVRRLRESAPAHEALRLVVNTQAGHRPDDRPE